ncbi:MAG: fumarylacetoacetate hydrolase family protein [Chloroflexi bacterium]|nr:fumarylacetoacetate hydrolase family protein [Chloroflexota bacterium]
MKLVFFDDFRLGILTKRGVVPFPEGERRRALRPPQDRMADLIDGFPSLHNRLLRLQKGKAIPLSKVRLRAPLPRPSKLLCAVTNYLELGQRPATDMDFFIKASSAVISPGDTIVLPRAQATVFHHEAELALVIGKMAREVPQSKAMDHVFGYTCLIDVSARGMMPDGRLSFFLGKSWDTFAPMGPALVTADEVPDPHNLQVRLWVDGQPRHDFNTSDMAHRIPELIEMASSVTTLFPGDVIATGTNHQGLGAIQDGEEVTIEIERIGRMSVRVRDPLRRSWPKGLDTAFAQQVVRSARR